MHPHAGVHFRVLHGAGLDHGLGANVFLVGLEHENDVAGQAFALFGQNFRGNQQHGGVRIVPASVRHARGGGGKGQACFLLDGQGVHVCAQHKGGAGTPPL